MSNTHTYLSHFLARFLKKVRRWIFKFYIRNLLWAQYYFLKCKNYIRNVSPMYTTRTVVYIGDCRLIPESKPFLFKEMQLKFWVFDEFCKMPRFRSSTRLIFEGCLTICFRIKIKAEIGPLEIQFEAFLDVKCFWTVVGRRKSENSRNHNVCQTLSTV